MVGSYSGVGLKSFVEDLKSGISERIDRFYEDITEKYKDDLEALASKPREEWTRMYMEWSQRQLAIRHLAEQYLMGNFPDEENT